MDSEFSPRQFTLGLLKEATERDKQVSIGASNLSNMCSRCLAEDMQGAGGDIYGGRFWLGAVIGTATHLLLESRTEPGKRYLPEQRVVVGEIPGYGVVKSTSDLFDKPSGTVVDYKTTTREKLKYIKRAVHDAPDEFEVTKVAQMRHKVSGYRNQGMLYGLGMENAGHTVNRVAFVFICRDGLNDDDVWEWPMPYDRDLALKVLDRGVRLWAWLSEGHTPDELSSAPHCWTCSMRRDGG